jgi:putative NADH-flavin reductase
MKIIIFGSTGRVGSKLVEQALEEGHAVTAFTREHSKIKAAHKNLTIYQGDIMDPVSVKDAVTGHEVVLCSIGGGRKGTVRSAGTLSIIRAMEGTNVRRLICQTTLGAGDSKGNLNFFWKHIMFGWFIKEAFLDHELQESYVRRSTLDWTIVRPAAFTDGPRTGKYRHGFSPDDKSVSLKISCADVADFMLKQLNNDRYLRKTPGLAY